MPTDEKLRNSIIELYQNVKIRKQTDKNIFTKEYLEKEKISLLSISPIVLIDYIKIHLNLLIDIKVNDKISKLKINPIDYISSSGSELPANDYEKLLRRYEGDIRNYIRIVNMLKIHIDELNEKQILLEKEIEQFQKDTINLNLVPTNQSIEYRKKIDELTALIKTYEKHNLQIPLLEKKIKIQKIELDKLDMYYKKQIKNYTKKIQDYEKGIYLTNINNNKIKKKIFNKNFNTSVYCKKIKYRMNSISPKKENNTLNLKDVELKSVENDKNIVEMKKTKSINNIFFQMKNNEIKKRIEDNISSNLNLNKTNVNGGNLYIASKGDNSENNIISPQFGDNKIIDNYYDSIENDEVDNKTINTGGTVTNFRKKINLKSNININKIFNKNGNKKPYTKSNSKKTFKKINNNRASLKIPKNINGYINTSKYIHSKYKNIPKIKRYNSLKQINIDKNKNLQNSTKESRQFNKTFSRIPSINNINITIGTNNNSNNHNNKRQRNSVKNFILNKINNINNIIVNRRSPIPLQKTQYKTNTFISHFKQ